MTVDFNEIINKTTTEDRARFKSEASRINHEAVVQKFIHEFFPTYNFMIAQSGKLMKMFEQDKMEAAIAVAIAAGMTIGSICGEDTDKAEQLLSMAVDIAGSITNNNKASKDGGADTFCRIMATGEVVEKQLVKYAIEKRKPFNPNEGEIYKEIMRGTEQKDLGN